MAKGKGYDYKKTLLSVTGLVALFLILIFVNIIVSYANIRWDVTEDNNYSLSDGTKNILSSLSEPVTIKFFYSQSNPDIPANIKIYAKEVRDFLSEYKHAGKGRIKVEIYDPKPDSDEEEWAEKYGIQPMRTPGGKIYCGLVFVSADQEDVIEWLDPDKEQVLEYDLTSIIQGIQSDKKMVVGIITSLPVFGTVGRPTRQTQGTEKEWLFITEMKKIYDVRQINPSIQKIDPLLNLLLVVFPKNLSPQLEYAIDQYVLSGGKALIFMDPLCVSDRTQGQREFIRSSGASLDKVFKAWGVSMDSTKAVADFDQPTQVRTGDNSMEENPLMISARGEAFNKNAVITAGLESMLFPIAGAIKKSGDVDSEFEPLVHSSRNSALMDAFKAYLGVEAIKKDFTPAGERFNIAVRLRGKFKTAFPEGQPNSKDSEGKKWAHIKEGKKPATIIIVSDADMLADQFYVQRRNVLGLVISEMFNDNLNFLSNASEILTGSDDLIGLRSRGKFERPFTAVVKLKRTAQERWLTKENELVKQMEETTQKLRQIEEQKDVSQEMILSPEQEVEITKFKEQRQKINRELKQVRRNLRASIETLGATLKGINIFLMPFLVALIGIGFAIYKHRKFGKK
ncbi:MAG: GldG family protein [Desulfobacteraceae bacterium]|nr:GldG family protein [Desulfobacteraceae bacterium]